MDHSVQTPLLNSDSHIKSIAMFLEYKLQLSTTQISDLTEIPRRTLSHLFNRPVSIALVDLRIERQHEHTLTDADLSYISDLLEFDDSRLYLDEIARLLREERGVVVSISTLCRELKVSLPFTVIS